MTKVAGCRGLADTTPSGRASGVDVVEGASAQEVEDLQDDWMARDEASHPRLRAPSGRLATSRRSRRPAPLRRAGDITAVAVGWHASKRPTNERRWRAAISGTDRRGATAAAPRSPRRR